MRFLLRWLVAGAVATVITLALFVTMTRLIDGSWLLDGLVWVFPLSQTELPPEEDCPEGPMLGSAVDIEGVVGTYVEGEFFPRADAEIVGRNALGSDVSVAVSKTGVFRFATAFQSDEPTSCPTVPASDQRLQIRASGCQDRQVPVTRAWIPHRVLLSCTDAG